MDALIPLVPVFVLGAMSPGPSLAVVLRNSVVGGRSQGVQTAIGHGIGFGIYAFLAAVGLAAAISASETTETVLRWGGIGLLLYLAYSYGRRAFAPQQAHAAEDEMAGSGRTGFIQGFLISFLNPKILAWLLAIYSPVIESDLALPVLLAIALMGMAIDMGWYASVALFMTAGNRAARIRAAAGKLDGAMALLMLVFAGLLVFNLV